MFSAPYSQCLIDKHDALWCRGDSDTNSVGVAPQGIVTEYIKIAEDAVKVGTRMFHGCLLDKEGFVSCWGGGGSEAYLSRLVGIGGGAYEDYDTPTRLNPELLYDVCDIAVGGRSNCALRGDGAVICWGRDGIGWVDPPECEGDNPPKECKAFRTLAMPIEPSLEDPIVEIDKGDVLGCGRRQSGQVVCWGGWWRYSSWNFRQFDDRGTSAPSLIEGVDDAISICVEDTGCSLNAKGEVKCWGSNNRGQLGDGTSLPHSNVTKVKGLPENVVELACADRTFCAITSDDQVWCWGQIEGLLDKGERVREIPLPVEAIGPSDGAPAPPGPPENWKKDYEVRKQPHYTGW